MRRCRANRFATTKDRLYECQECGKQEVHRTNHTGQTYPHCGYCNKTTTWEYIRDIDWDKDKGIYSQLSPGSVSRKIKFYRKTNSRRNPTRWITDTTGEVVCAVCGRPKRGRTKCCRVAPSVSFERFVERYFPGAQMNDPEDENYVSGATAREFYEDYRLSNCRSLSEYIKETQTTLPSDIDEIDSDIAEEEERKIKKLHRRLEGEGVEFVERNPRCRYRRNAKKGEEQRFAEWWNKASFDDRLDVFRIACPSKPSSYVVEDWSNLPVLIRTKLITIRMRSKENPCYSRRNITEEDIRRHCGTGRMNPEMEFIQVDKWGKILAEYTFEQLYDYQKEKYADMEIDEERKFTGTTFLQRVK